MNIQDTSANQEHAPHAHTIVSLFAKACKKNGSSELIQDSKSLSYTELDQHSNSLCNQILWGQQSGEEPLITVLMERSLDAVIAQLGILKSGSAYLPLSPEDFPIERIRIIFDDAEIKHIVTLAKYEPLINELQTTLGRALTCYYVDHNAQLDIDKQTNHSDCNQLIKNIDIDPQQLAYVMYTSGSTGKPKGVMVSHENIVSTVFETDYLNINQDDTVLHAAPISFDAASFEIWAALLNGLSLYIADNALVRDIHRFADNMISQKINVAWLTSALCNLIADTRLDFFSQLNLLLVGGEALSPSHINKIRKAYPNIEIRNNYGPTENTIFSTSFLIEQDYLKRVPIGHAISHKRAYILDEQLRPTLPGQTGELFVAGSGVAKGYLNRPAETQKKFINDPFHENQKMYATGDLCCYNSDGHIEYIGRTDHQIKVMGHRIELGEIESAIKALPKVEQAVIVYKHLSDSHKGIAAYIQLDTTKAQGKNFEVQEIRNSLSISMPTYMIPSYFEFVSEFPITTNGKIDRKALESKSVYRENVDTKTSRRNSSISEQEMHIQVTQACCRVLEKESIDSANSFFALGGDSLSGTCLMVELSHQLNKELPLQLLYESSTIDGLCCSLMKIINSDSRPRSHRVSSDRLINDAALNSDCNTRGKSVHEVHEEDLFRSKLFMTGATGFFGAFLLRTLLDQSQASIFCLVRAKDTRHGLQRILDTFSKYQIPISEQDKSRLLPIPGDLEKPNFGLHATQFGELSMSVDEIYHCGASVNYVDTYDKLKKTNVDGSKEVLRLASMNRLIPLHYISSVSVFETVGYFTGKKTVYENESVEGSADLVKLGYSQSKWVAEKLMENAQQAGLPVNIYRTGYIMGHSQTGISNTTDHIARYIAGCIEMACAPILDEYASLAPVDQLSAALAHITLITKPRGRTFHLCNPEFTTVDKIYRNIQTFGFDLTLMPYSEWKQKLIEAPTSNPLYPLLSLHIHSAPDHELTLPELYERNAQFDCTNLLSALHGSGINIQLNDKAIFEKWLFNYVEAGLISQERYQQALGNQSSYPHFHQAEQAHQHINYKGLEVAC